MVGDSGIKLRLWRKREGGRGEEKEGAAGEGCGWREGRWLPYWWSEGGHETWPVWS